MNPPTGIQKPENPNPAQQTGPAKPNPPDVHMLYGLPCVRDDMDIVAKYGLPVDRPGRPGDMIALYGVPIIRPDPTDQRQRPTPVLKYGLPCFSKADEKPSCGLKALIMRKGKEYVKAMLGHTKSIIEARQQSLGTVDGPAARPIGATVDPLAYGSSRATNAMGGEAETDETGELLNTMRLAYAEALKLD